MLHKVIINSLEQKWSKLLSHKRENIGQVSLCEVVHTTLHTVLYFNAYKYKATSGSRELRCEGSVYSSGKLVTTVERVRLSSRITEYKFQIPAVFD